MRVSVIIPTYNYADKIAQAIDSILIQEYGNLEIIILDDGSTDETESVVNKYLGLYSFIKYIKQINKGKASATYEAFCIATGDIVFNLDADDCFLPNKINRVVAEYMNNQELVMVSHAAQINIDNKKIIIEDLKSLELVDRIIDGYDMLKLFLKNNCLYGGGSTFSVRRSCFKMSEEIVNADMYIDECLVYLACSFGKVLILSNSLSVWNVHGANFSVANNLGSKADLLKQIRLLKSGEGVFNLVKKHIHDKECLFLLRLKHFERVCFSNQKLARYHSWILSGIALFIHMLRLLLMYKGNSMVIKKYNILNRYIPPFAYNFLKAH